MDDQGVFVTESVGLQTKIIRGIHHMSAEAGGVRIWTFDKINHPHAVEHRINGDLLFDYDDLMHMLGQVSEFMHGPAGIPYRERLFLVRERGH